MNQPNERPVIFFDGVCNLCNGFVDFLLRRDREGLFEFAPLQGATARRLVPRESASLDSIVLWNQGEVTHGADAALLVLERLGGFWGLARVGWLVPASLRGWVYRAVARNRYALFGRRDTCRLPTPAERARFRD